MARTLFPDTPVNKASNLAKTHFEFIHDVCIDGIRAKLRQCVDRVQLSVDSRCWDYCFQQFEQTFPRIKANIVSGKRIIEYKVESSSVQLVKYFHDEKPYSNMWFSIVAHDPTKPVLETLQQILNSALCYNNLGESSVSLTQAEFATDFWALDNTMQDNLRTILSNSVVLKYSRLSSCKIIKTTTYQGTGGNVRVGTKGLRCYPKETTSTKRYRIELQTNRTFNRRYGININNFIEYASSYNFEHYFYLYKNITQNTVEHIVKRLILKMRPNFPLKPMTLGQRIFMRAMQNGILDGLRDGEGFMPVVKQMEHMKKFYELANLSYHKDRLFCRLEITT